MKLEIVVDSTSPVPLTQQVYEELRQLILSGKLQAGEKIPSSRALAEHLGISRPTVTEAFEQLLAEGYVQARHGSGTFVSKDLPDGKKTVKSSRQRLSSKTPRLQLSKYGRSIEARPATPRSLPECEISFYYGRPAFEEFPLGEWARSLWRHARLPDIRTMDYASDARGHASLRQAIAEFVHRHRGIECNAGQVLVAMGLQQALDLVTRLHVEPGDTVVVENPSYPGAWDTFTAHGGELLPVPVDESGLIVDRLPDAKTRECKLVYLTPSHQFPTGAVLSLARRLELLAWAARAGALIFEDDYDSEYRYEGRPIQALKALDQHGSVIYVGNFNQVMFPGLNLCYLILPEHLVELYESARWLAGEQLPVQVQAAVASFMQDGHLDRHIRRLRALYGERRQTLLDALSRHLGKRVSVSGDNAGVFVLARFTTKLSDRAIIEAASKTGVGLISTKDFYLGPAHGKEFILGYGNLTARQVEEGVRRLARVFG